MINNKKSHKDFATCVEGFFKDYLIRQRGVSSNTIRAYRDVFVHYLDFMNQNKRISADRIELRHFTKDSVAEFLDWLEQNRHNCTRTRNQRLAVLHSFCNYMLYIDVENMAQWKSITQIKMKRKVKVTMNYLSPEGLSLLLSQINTDSKRGRRDLALLSLLYYSGARVQELIHLTPSSIRRGKPYMIKLVGKGAKERLVLLNDSLEELLDNYLKENRLDSPQMSDRALFFNAWHGKMTTPGITYILNKYVDKARIVNNDLIVGNITPHIIRHSRAMHLLQAGWDLIHIRDFLGHASITTTEVYARIDSKAKREAIEKAYEQVGIKEPEAKSWEKDLKLKAFLKNLY
ncbi:site-specific recombinase XerD [Dysgonomonas alginatilytica]|uniref:Site-specific recombinase XerD n=1 Tax=Dysgonomonas alginatilytica TaxID=1605892 RepID=A0A2V3PP63_9BACT|nr:tyrosine-type recombinase/integrase [Dysgonomonas alginatilytica]PXV56008.1 site-specific recombinase XerD [Dysgonomonas alginatilytica]